MRYLDQDVATQPQVCADVQSELPASLRAEACARVSWVGVRFPLVTRVSADTLHVLLNLQEQPFSRNRCADLHTNQRALGRIDEHTARDAEMGQLAEIPYISGLRVNGDATAAAGADDAVVLHRLIGRDMLPASQQVAAEHHSRAPLAGLAVLHTPAVNVSYECSVQLRYAVSAARRLTMAATWRLLASV